MSLLKELKKEAKPDTSEEEITGTIDFVRFHSPESGYCVLKIDRVNGPSCTTVGYMASPQENSQYKFKGEWIKHEKYGWQFKFDEFELHLPENRSGITRYLESVMYGVGPVRAKMIVDELGEKTLQKIKDEPSILEKFDFIEQKQINEITKDLNENSLQAEFKSSICRRGISAKMASRIWTTYVSFHKKDPSQILTEIEENPYILINDIDRIGFKTADKIARSLGIEKNSPFRLQAAIKHILKESTTKGHVYLPFSKIYRELCDLLNDINITEKEVAITVKKMSDIENKLERESNDIYLKNLNKAEKQLANQIKRIVRSEEKEYEDDFNSEIVYQEKQMGIDFAHKQKKAISRALKNNISIITGGPGTGKTTIIKAICSIYNTNWFPGHSKLYLASPTGKAAKRMEEQTGEPAQTIHRLLKYNSFTGGFQYNFNNPLPGPGLLIVDEFSMCDLQLARDLFAALETNMKIVLVGDIDQLPSVGAGRVLHDLINSGEIPVTKLEYNYRQANGSIIAKRANEIANGEKPELTTEGDFEYIKISGDDELAAEKVLEQVKKLHANMVSPMKFQVLSPMKKGSSGVHNLNKKIREIVNPKGHDIPPNGTKKQKNKKVQLGNFRLGDKVMVVHNDYDKMVFNGDLGKVNHIEGNKLYVDILGNEDPEPVEFKVSDLDLLQLAYASTIHKSQGSEFPIVIMVLTFNHYIMLKRNLVYTGMTRAKDKFILIGDKRAFMKAIRNNKVEKRYSKLAERVGD